MRAKPNASRREREEEEKGCKHIVFCTAFRPLSLR